MTRRFALLAVVLMWALVVVAAPANAKSSASQNRAEQALEPTQIIVKYRGNARSAEVRERVAAKLVDKLPGQALEVLDPQGSVEETIAQLEADPQVAYAEPDYVYTAAAVEPDDLMYPSMWGLKKIDLPDAWGATTGDPSVTVAVVDSGVALNHPDLAPNIWKNPGETGSGKESNGIDDDSNGFVDDWRGWDWVNEDNRPGDANGHGSHVAGTVAARGNNGIGIAGVSWHTSLMPLRALDTTGMGMTSEIAAAFTYAGRMGADVVNASLGGSGNSLTLLNAINNAPDTLFVVAAGNEANNNDAAPQYPCNYNVPNLVCVAASDSSDNLASFSNYGATSVDLAAPGTSILSLAPALSTPLREEFETDIAGRWVTGGQNNLWARLVDTQGGYITDSPGINYLSDTDSWIATANPFSLAGQSDCRLLYSLKLETEKSNDALVVEMSRDGDSWTKIAGWTGSSNGSWVPRSEDARTFDGVSSAFVRFRMRTNSTVDAAGVDIDNVRMQCQSDTYSGSEYRSMSGTSMAAPHVAGVAALVKAAAPQTTVAGLISALVRGVETSPGLFGKVSTGGRVSAAGSLMAVGASGVGGEGPITDPLPEPEPEPTSEPSPEPTAEPEPIPTIQPQPDPSNEPEPVPTDDPAEVVEADHERRITLKLRRALVAAGRVNVVETYYAKCAAGVRVKIKRNGKVIKQTRTNDTGFYRVRLPNRRGRYIAIATKTTTEDVPTQTCLGDRSPMRRRR